MSRRILPRFPVTEELVGPLDSMVSLLKVEPRDRAALSVAVEKAKQQAILLNQRIDEIQAVLASMQDLNDGNALGLSRALPRAVGAVPIAGASSTASPSDHVHRGVSSIEKDAEAYGPIRFVGECVTQAGQTFTFAVPGAPDTLVVNETPTGAVNGINTTYTLAFRPISDGHLWLFVGGQLWNTGGRITSVTNETIVVSTPPQTGQVIRAWYWKQV